MNFMSSFTDFDNNRSDDRIIELRPMEGKKTLDSKGLVDSSLFKGDNKLHAIKEPDTNFWYVKYEKGAVPPSLKDKKYTKFESLLNAVKLYYGQRNVEVVEVKD